MKRGWQVSAAHAPSRHTLRELRSNGRPLGH